jgi:hypothetical protein
MCDGLINKNIVKIFGEVIILCNEVEIDELLIDEKLIIVYHVSMMFVLTCV